MGYIAILKKREENTYSIKKYFPFSHRFSWKSQGNVETD